MIRRRIKLALALVVILGLMLSPSTVSAEEAPLKMQKLKPELLVPSQVELFSGRAWLVLSGQDPGFRLSEALGEKGEPSEVALQAVGAAGAAFIPYRSPAAKFSRTVLLSRDVGRIPYQTEPHLAVNPQDPDHILVALIDYNFPGIASYTSIDGGTTWNGPRPVKIPREELAGAGDPTVAFDRQGNSYAAQLTLRIEDFRLGPLVGSAVVTSVSVGYSADGGISWKETIVAPKGGVEAGASLPAGEERLRGEVWVYSFDKPWLSVGANPEKPGQDVIYIGYTNFIDRWQLAWMDEVPVLMLIEEQSAIEVVRSEDGGLTWSKPIQVSPRVYLRGKEGLVRRVVHGSQPIVAPDGTLYVAWFDSTDDGVWKGVAEIWVAASKDLGRTFGRPVLADKLLEVGVRPRTSSFRLWATGFPQMAVGPEGEVYITYTAFPSDNPEDGGDVFLVRSLDGGKTWERRIRVNDDRSGRLQFFPAIAVDPNGTLHMIWGDTRDDPAELAYHIYYASSKDKGKTWEVNSRVSDFPSNPNFAFSRGQFIGDYFALKATKEDVYIVWADSRLGEVGGTNQKVGFARKRLMPAPATFLSPPSGSAGRDITIQGHNFQPDSEIFVDIGGVLTATGLTKADGTFSLTVFAPISGEGSRSVVIRDMSGNVATASFFTEFGFDTLRQRLSPEAGSVAGVFLWLIVALAAALVVALIALMVVWYRVRSRATG